LFKIGSCYVVQVDLEILLLQPLENWDYRHASQILKALDKLEPNQFEDSLPVLISGVLPR
jgi:hypothetical protein